MGKIVRRSLVLFTAALLMLAFVGCGGEGHSAVFCAEPFVQDPSLSSMYSLDVRMAGEGKVYINDVLYAETADAVPPVLSFSDVFLSYAAHCDEVNGNSEMTDALASIGECDVCSVLETDADGRFGKTIYVYDTNGFRYYVRLFDNGEICRIHRAVMQ